MQEPNFFIVLVVNPVGDILQQCNSNNEPLTVTVNLNSGPHWNWIGDPGLAEWLGVWRRDRRFDSYGALSDVESTDNSLQKGKITGPKKVCSVKRTPVLNL